MNLDRNREAARLLAHQAWYKKSVFYFGYEKKDLII